MNSSEICTLVSQKKRSFTQRCAPLTAKAPPSEQGPKGSLESDVSCQRTARGSREVPKQQVLGKEQQPAGHGSDRPQADTQQKGGFSWHFRHSGTSMALTLWVWSWQNSSSSQLQQGRRLWPVICRDNDPQCTTSGERPSSLRKTGIECQSAKCAPLTQTLPSLLLLQR